MAFLRSVIFFIGATVSMLIIASTGILLAVIPFGPRYYYLTRWGAFTLWWLKLTCGLDYVVEGREHIPETAALIFCKHSSTWETLALQGIFPPQVWVLKRELMWIPIFGWALGLLKPIAINRDAGRRAVDQIVEQGTQRLEEGLWVAIFPEGTRVAPGKHKKWGIGGAVLAAASGHPVVPVAHNAGYFWARHQFVKHPGTIRLVIGPPIDTRGLSASEVNHLAESWVAEHMQAFDDENKSFKNK